MQLSHFTGQAGGGERLWHHGDAVPLLLTTLAVVPETATVITESCLTLHNVMRTRYPGLQNVDLDQVDDEHQLVPGPGETRG